MTDAELIGVIRDDADDLQSDDYRGAANRIRQAADRLEKLAAVLEAAETVIAFVAEHVDPVPTQLVELVMAIHAARQP